MKEKCLAVFTLALLILSGCANQEAILNDLLQKNQLVATDTSGSATVETTESLLPGQTPKPEPKYAIAFSQAMNESAWEKANTNNIQATASQNNIQLHYNHAKNNLQSQLRFLESCAAYNDDKTALKVVAFSPVVEEGWEKTLAALKKAKRSVIVVGNPIAVDHSLYDVYIHADWHGQGKAAAKWLLKNRTDQSKKIVELRDYSNATISEKKHTGFSEGIVSEKGWTIIEDRSIMDSRIDGKNEMMHILAPEYDRYSDKEKPAVDSLAKIDVVFAHTDDMALGAIEAITELGLQPGKDVTVVCIGGSKAALAAIKEGHLSACIENDPLYGETLMSIVDHLATGKTGKEKEVLLVGEVFDEKNASKYYTSRLY